MSAVIAKHTDWLTGCMTAFEWPLAEAADVRDFLIESERVKMLIGTFNFGE